MPEIDLSDDLYQQIRSASAGKDIEETLWEMVGEYKRTNMPEADAD